jgi:hypothetical protein
MKNLYERSLEFERKDPSHWMLPLATKLEIIQAASHSKSLCAVASQYFVIPSNIRRWLRVFDKILDLDKLGKQMKKKRRRKRSKYRK